MPTFYEGEPVEKITVKLESSDFQKAYWLAEQYISPIHRRGVKVGICLTIAILIGSTIPLYANKFSSYWIPICAVLCALAAAAFFFFKQPSIIKKWAKQLFESNALLQQENEVIILRDSIVIQNQYEKQQEYWTDFDQCLENPQFYVLVGGMNRSLVVIKKKNLTGEQADTVSAHLFNSFARRYHKAKR
jgi:hypothetical protein